MNPEDILRRIPWIEKASKEIDFKSLNYRWGTVKRRVVDRRDARRDEKASKEASKTVALRLHKKLMERGRTPNLNSNFYAKASIHA